MRELALFAGAGGGLLASRLLGWRTVCAVEIDAYCRSVLIARQNDGSLEPFPIWDDARTFDGRPWRGSVDVVSGGFPCQDISSAGRKAGIEGDKSGLWSSMARVIRDVQPRVVFVENTPALTHRGLDVVLGDLAAMGFDAEWGVVGAHNAGAPHKRDRIWIVARHPDRDCESVVTVDDEASWLSGMGEVKNRRRGGFRRSLTDWWKTEPDVDRVAHVVAARMDRLRAIGNGQVPVVAALAYKILSGRLRETHE